MRVGDLQGEDPMRLYEALGLSLKDVITRSLPGDWTWEGKRGLDFGAGAGRVLRHFAAEATVAQLWGCDIDARSVEWLRQNLCPPFQAFVVTPEPSLLQPADYFDVVWAFSVFTHLADHWAGWLVQLHRALKPGGYLIASYLGHGMARELTGATLDEATLGMNVGGHGRPWHEGGPWVFHSEWWLRSHWGRAYEIVELHPGQADPAQHGLIVLRKRAVAVTPADLISPEPADEREQAALQANLRQLHAEDRRLRERIAQLEARMARRPTARAWRYLQGTPAGPPLRRVRSRTLLLRGSGSAVQR
jgi:SAM-dependent methyltransferase